jgi:ATP-binding cassette subfamily C protein
MGFDTVIPHRLMILYAVIAVGVIYFIKNLFSVVEIFCQQSTIQRMNYRFKKKLLWRYAQIDYNYYLTRNASEGVAVVASDAELTFTNGLGSLSIIFTESIIFLSLVSVIIYIEPKLALYLFALGAIVGWVVVKKLFPLFYSWGKDIQEYTLHSNKNILQFFHAFKEIILLGKKESFINVFHFYSRKKSKIQVVQNVTNNLPRIVTEFLFVFLLVFIVSYFSIKADRVEKMIGLLGGYLYVGFRLMPGLNRIIMQLNVFKSIIPCIERVYTEYNTIMHEQRYSPCPQFQFNHLISLKDISFRYLNTKRYALSHCSLDIKKGECIGVMGETGSGKSTLIDVILGLLKPETGSVLIDEKYPAQSQEWHSRIGYVQQSIYLTDDTIKANIAFGELENDIDLKRLAVAIDGAQLQKFIQQLPEGIETLVGERGVRLSGGERQRIAVARALYRNPEVFIFDEATSALDNETEKRLMETVDNLRGGSRTIIIIAHRLSTLKNCDRIVEMRDGQIKQIIKYNELIQDKSIA